MNDEIQSVVVGKEFDDKLKDSIRIVLDRLGAVCVDKSWGLGGSQEYEKTVFNVGGEQITIESETYVGITISGPRVLVEKNVLGL
ncbi:hypothetical protein D3C85_1602130 [compost metagenome]|jgi:hypothetical protein